MSCSRIKLFYCENAEHKKKNETKVNEKRDAKYPAMATVILALQRLMFPSRLPWLSFPEVVFQQPP
jgi:hypothetical protein